MTRFSAAMVIGTLRLARLMAQYGTLPVFEGRLAWGSTTTRSSWQRASGQ